MGAKARARATLNALLHRFGQVIVDERMLYDWQKASYQTAGRSGSAQLPAGAADYLVPDNARLRELQARYAAFDDRVTTPLVWTDDHVSSEDMLYFRGDNAYVWQVRKWSMNIMVYALTTYYVRSIDTLGLLDKLEEDDDFGIHTVQIDNKRVSRDLLDSIVEIHFLEKHLGISSRRDVTVLDIGAGYGRLAHRMLGALPNISRYLCTDAVPVSTFVCEHYLRHRRLDDRAKVVPLDEIEDTVSAARVDVAVNVHSFSECRLPAIDWWLSLLAKNNVKYLMIVPNTDALKTKDGQDFTPIIEQHGYRLKAAEPKFSDPVVQQYGINPVHHYLFELREHRSG